MRPYLILCAALSIAGILFGCSPSSPDPVTPPPPPVVPPPSSPVPIQMSLAPTSRSVTTRRDEAAPSGRSEVRFSGDGSQKAQWTAGNRKPWLALESRSGVGNDDLTWSRNATGLAPGIWVDTITVVAPGALGSPARIIDSLTILPPLPLEVGTLTVAPSAFPSDFFVRAGDEVQLTSTVMSTTGVAMPDEPVQWEAANPNVVTISPAGLVRFRQDTALGTRDYMIQARAGARTANVYIPAQDWSLTRTQDPVTLKFQTSARLEPLPGKRFGGISLAFTCIGDYFMASFHHAGVNYNGFFDYRFSGKAPVHTEWDESVGFSGLFAPTPAAARSFGAQMAGSDTLHASILFFSSGSAQGTWLLRGWEYSYGRVSSACQ